ncbi:MAG: hypothetical protein RJB39_485 [Candidatus Parcubacteria bacterium]|jgi:hypothetical protein
MSNIYKGKKLIFSLIFSFILVQVFFITVSVSAQAQPQSPISQLVTVPLGGINPSLDSVPGTPGPNGTINNKSILKTIVGSEKECQFVDQGLYKPFSNISTDFAIFNAFNMDGKTKPGCIRVQGGMDQFILLLFKIVIGFCSVLAVIYVAVAGIVMIIEQANIQKRIKAREMLLRAGQGLLLSLVAWILLFTINKRLVQFSVTGVFQATGVQQTITQGLQTAAGANIDIIAGGNNLSNFLAPPTVLTSPGTPGYGVLAPGSANTYAGTQNSLGASPAGISTIFGYRDGNGVTGREGDNGIGNGGVSYMSSQGYTHYNGDPRSRGVAVPPAWITRDFGSYAGAKNSAYAIFEGGRHIGNFPIVDTSEAKLDLTFGLVQQYLSPGVTNSNGWSSFLITYKPLPNFYATNSRLTNPMIEDKVIQVQQGGVLVNKPIDKALPSQITDAIQNGRVKVIYQ